MKFKLDQKYLTMSPEELYEEAIKLENQNNSKEALRLLVYSIFKLKLAIPPDSCLNFENRLLYIKIYFKKSELNFKIGHKTKSIKHLEDAIKDIEFILHSNMFILVLEKGIF